MSFVDKMLTFKDRKRCNHCNYSVLMVEVMGIEPIDKVDTNGH